MNVLYKIFFSFTVLGLCLVIGIMGLLRPMELRSFVPPREWQRSPDRAEEKHRYHWPLLGPALFLFGLWFFALVWTSF